MPTYGYQCTRCDNAFEVVQKIVDPPLTECERCGGELRKKIFPVGIAFKGSGFYVNDYAGPSAKKASESESGAPPAADAVKSDAAPAAAPASETAAPVASEAKPAVADAKPAAAAPKSD